jgi:hypothetical protein
MWMLPETLRLAGEPVTATKQATKPDRQQQLF